MRSLIALSFAVLAGCAAPGPGPGLAQHEEAVKASTAAWAAAYDSRDPARITALYDSDAVLWGTASPTVRSTPAAIADYFKDAPKRPHARVTVSDQHVRIIGDAAVNSGTYTFNDVRDGKPVSNPARFTFVYRKRGGQWLIVSHHSSRLPPPQ